MNCSKCGTELNLKKIVFRTGKIHFSSWCKECRKQKYIPQTEENIRTFENVKKFQKSKALKEVERIQFEKSPQSVLGKFGSDYELLFATIFKEKYRATILKRGCPDFFIESNGKIFFVEVKHKGDKLSRYQRRFIEMLEKIGIKVFISKEGKITPEIERYMLE